MKPGDKSTEMPGTMCMFPPMFVNNDGIWERLIFPGEWIKVKDRLPEEDKLVVMYDNIWNEYRLGWRNDVEGLELKNNPSWTTVEGSHFYEVDTITHWMEIPPLPKEENEKS